MQLQKMMYVPELLLNNKKMTPQPFLQSLFLIMKIMSQHL
jgi:hypothetical protein